MRLRPRFSVRRLAIVVTLVCAYFGAWEATKQYGLRDVQQYLEESGRLTVSIRTRLPFLVDTEEVDDLKNATRLLLPSTRTEVSLVRPLSPGYPNGAVGRFEINEYWYLWFFGHIYRF